MILAGTPAPALAASSAPPSYLAPTAALVVAAAVIGYLSVRLRVVPIVGFLLAGVVIGPLALGLVDTAERVEVVADIGVILLLFTIGIEFSLDRLLRIRRYILLGGGLQVGLTTAATLGVLAAFGVGWRDGLYTGFLVALSSTAIVLKLLASAGRTASAVGQVSLAVLVFQDLAVVLMVLLVPVLGEGGGDTADLLGALATAILIIALVLVLARRVMPVVLEQVARACSPEVFLLAVIAICLGTAYLTSLAGVSVSLGAFLAGLVVSESRHSEHALGEVLPLQILFSAVFFVSVGMLLDLGFLVRNLPLVLGAVLAVVLLKVVVTGVSVAVLRVGAPVAASTAFLLAQVGEFSFVLQRVGADNGLSPAGLGPDGSQVFVAATVLLMVATPLLAGAGDAVAARLARRAPRPVLASPPGGAQAGERSGHVVVSGWGSTARRLAADLHAAGVPFLVTTLNPEGAAQAEAAGYEVLRGDSTRQHVLAAAGVSRASMVVVAEDDVEMATRIATLVRDLNPRARIVVRPVGGVDLPGLAVAGVDKVVVSDRAAARELSRSVLADVGGAVTHGGAGGRRGEGARSGGDPTALVHYRPAPGSACPHLAQIRPVLPSAAGCEDCLRTGDSWVHLRICLTCGYAGCCDSSPNRHARAHHTRSDHPLIASLEPGEDWAYCFLDDTTLGPLVAEGS